MEWTFGGTLAVIAAPVLGVYGIVNAAQAGWSSTVTLGCLAAAVLVVVPSVLIEQRCWLAWRLRAPPRC